MLGQRHRGSRPWCPSDALHTPLGLGKEGSRMTENTFSFPAWQDRDALSDSVWFLKNKVIDISCNASLSRKYMPPKIGQCNGLLGGSRTSVISIVWVFLWKAHFWAPPKTYRWEILGVRSRNLCFHKPYRGFCEQRSMRTTVSMDTIILVAFPLWFLLRTFLQNSSMVILSQEPSSFLCECQL